MRQDFRIPERGVRFQFGASEYRFAKDAASWQTAPEDGRIFTAAEQALLSSINVAVSSVSVTLGIHMQPISKAREDILAPLIPPPFKAFLEERKKMSFANLLKWEGGYAVIDYSAGFANGIFLRLTSDLNGHPSLEDILSKMRSEEDVLLRILDLEEEGDG